MTMNADATAVPRLVSASQGSIGSLEGVPNQVDELTTEFEHWRRHIASDPSYSAVGREAAVRERQDSARARLDQLKATAQIHADAAAMYLDQANARLAEKSTQEQILSEQQAQRAWQRVQRLLDAGVAPIEVAERLARAGEREAIRQLRRELPTWTAAAVAKAAGGSGLSTNHKYIEGVEEEVRRLDRRIEDLELPLMGSDERAVVTARRRFEAARVGVKEYVRLADKIIDGTYTPHDRIRLAHAVAHPQEAA